MKILSIITTSQPYQATAKLRGKVRRVTSHRYFARAYALAALAVLLLSTLYWSFLSARINQSNADQLIDPMLFGSKSNFTNAGFPGSHTFLLKWPLFYIVRIFGLTPGSYIGFTIVTVLITVGVLAFVLYRIERRPLVFGTICLALASVLMLVPTTPSSGALLPVNMAMLATRNLEYVLYIASLICLARAKRIKSLWFAGGIGLLGLLIASDKIFLYLTLGGALIGLFVYALVHGWSVVSMSANWLVAGLAAAIVAAGIYRIFTVTKVTNIIGAGSAVGPYGLVSNLKTIVMAAIYAFTGLLTNFGANPAFHTSIIKNLPRDGVQGLLSSGGLGFIVNALILLLSLFTVYKLIRASLAYNRDKRLSLDDPARLALMLVASSVAAIGVFIVSNHYYAGDARYLAIAVFAVFVSLAVYSRRTNFSPNVLAAIGGICLLAIASGGILSFKTYQLDRLALAGMNTRNQRVAQALTHHKVDALAADYWRSVPVRVVSDNRINIVPLANCTVPRNVLTTKDWNKDLNKDSFAYLLSMDKSLTDFPTCSLDQVITNYGRPNASLVIDGTLEDPKELLLFYDNGAHVSAPVTNQTQTPATVTPISLDELPNTSCPVPTIMNIVAHQDDDLLFMNPDLHKNIEQGYCIRTIYLTAGDAGSGDFYYLKREQGAEAAYDAMLTSKQIWVNRIVKISDNAYITVANPRGNNKISLIFLHLPDGNMGGQGFSSSGYQNLERLDDGSLDRLKTIDGSSSYSSAELTSTLSLLMAKYLPTEINTQSMTTGQQFFDHRDHNTVGKFAKQAYEKFETEQFDNRVTIPFNYYKGYPVHEQAENISGAELTQKIAVFLSYGAFDDNVCHSVAACSADPAYGAYLRRMYKSAQ